VPGGGRKPVIDTLEEMVAAEVVELRLVNTKVIRSFIADRAQQLAEEGSIQLKATNSWVTTIMQS